MIHRKVAIGIGICMGVIVPLVAMVPSSRSANAAVAVYDAQNVAEAIQTVTNTLNILTNEQAQLALDILNSTSLDATKIISIFQKQQNAQGNILFGDASVDPEILAGAGKVPGILNRNTTPETVLMSKIGDISDIFNQKISLEDVFQMTQMNTKALDATYKDAATMAQNVQTSDSALNSSVNEALEAANHAQGYMQVQQANAAINAAEVQSIQNGNQLLANILASKSQEAYANNYEKAATAQLEQNSKTRLSKWVNNFDASK
jgi:type IV secretion system protein TrbJ